jgi:hypothetical protein
MPPSTWSTPRRSRPSQRGGDAVDSGGSGCSGTSSGGGWAGDVDGDTASGGAALAGGARRQAPRNQCHHQSHLPPLRPWRGSSPTSPPALRRLPQRGRCPRAPDREGAGVSAPVSRPIGRPAVAEGPSGAEGRLATSSGPRGANRLRTLRKSQLDAADTDASSFVSASRLHAVARRR